MRGTRTLGALTGLVAAFSLTACSSGANPADVHATSSVFSGGSSTSQADGDNPGAVTSPSPGAVTSGDHSFNFVVPPGWNLTANPKTQAYLSSATVDHFVAPTIVVTTSDVKPAPAVDDVVQMAMMQARQRNATTERSSGRRIGGEAAEGFTADTVDSNVSVRRTYYITVHDGTAYTITLTAAKAGADAATAGLNSMLSSWTWSKTGDKNSTASGTTPAQSSTTTSGSSSPSGTGSSSSGASSSSTGSTAPSAASSSHATASTSAGHPTASSTAASTAASSR